MAGRSLKRDPVVATRAALDTELFHAVQDLRRKRIDVHGSRKKLKRARALLRLLRDAFGEQNYRRINTGLRDAARKLSDARDAEVLLLTLQGITTQGGRPVPRLSGFKRALRQEQRARRGVTTKHVTAISTRIERVRHHAETLVIRTSGWPTIAGSLKRTYAHGRRERQSAKENSTPERLHEWRKQVKYYWHQLEALDQLTPRVSRNSIHDLHKLSNLLGDDHDLFVLRSRLARASKVLDQDAVLQLNALIDRKRLKLQRKAFSLGSRLYEQTPKHVERHFS